jgi:hypothetical protein
MHKASGSYLIYFPIDATRIPVLTNSFIHIIISHFQRILLANDDCPSTMAKNYCLMQGKSVIALQAHPMQEVIIQTRCSLRYYCII